MTVEIVALVGLAGVIGLGLLAVADPEAGWRRGALPPLVRARPTFLEPRARELFARLHGPCVAAGLVLVPRARLEAVLERGRLDPTGWHRMRHEEVDFLLVRALDFQPVGLLWLEEAAPGGYLARENRPVREQALREVGLPTLELPWTEATAGAAAAQVVEEWLGREVLPYSAGSSTQVDLL